MSRVDNKSVERGTTITAESLNEKYSDVTEVTSGQLDEANFRNEAIDQPNLIYKTSTDGAQGFVLKGYGKMDNGGDASPWVYYANDVTTPYPVSHGTGGVLSFGSDPLVVEPYDVLRVYWDLVVEDMNETTSAGGTSMDPLEEQQPGAFWLCWLQWDITSSALTNWAEVPNQADHAAETTDVSSSAATHGLMVIPHVWLVYSQTTNNFVDLTLTNTAFRQAWYYMLGGTASINVYGFRLVVHGVYKPFLTADRVSELRHDADWTPANSITIGQVNIKAIHMDGGGD